MTKHFSLPLRLKYQKNVMPLSITSTQNPKIKQLLALQQKSSERRKNGLFVVEGRRELEHCIAAGYEVESVFADSPPALPIREGVVTFELWLSFCMFIYFLMFILYAHNKLLMSILVR